jgi:hypothetical protein
MLAWSFLFSGEGQAQTHDGKIDLYEKKFRCSLALEAKLELEGLSQSQLIESLKKVETELEQEISKGELIQLEKKIIKESLRNIKVLMREVAPKEKLVSFYDKICLKSESLFKDSFKALAHTSHLVVLTASFPFRFLKSFYTGFRTGESDQVEALPAYDILGKERSRSISIFLLTRAYSVIQGGNPIIAPLYALPWLNLYVMMNCDVRRKLDQHDLKFCQNFMKLKKIYLKSAQRGSDLGKKMSLKKETKRTPEVFKEIGEENFCDYLEDLSHLKTQKKKALETREVLLENLNPGFMARPQMTPYRASQENLKSMSPAQMLKLRHVVISLSPHDEAIKNMKESGEFEEYLALKKEVSHLTKTYNKLYRLKNKVACLELKAKTHFSVEKYQELKRKLQEMKTPAFYEQGLVIQKQFKALTSKWNISSKLNLNWEFISSNSLEVVHQLLTSRDVGNVILITHSVGEYKKLVDAHFNQYPTTFFKQISPTIMSLSFFTCHSQNILSTYNLEDILNATPTIHQERWLNFVSTNDWSSSPDTVPGLGFKDFFQKVDHRLSISLQENILNQSLGFSDSILNGQDFCRVEVNLENESSAGLSVILNKVFIGHLDGAREKNRFMVPCSLLQGRNNLIFQKSSLLNRVKINPRIEGVLINDQYATIQSEKFYFNGLNEFSSLRLEF